MDIRNRSYSITAEVVIPKGGAQGVLLADGGTFGGYSFFVNKKQQLQFSYNYVGLEEFRVVSKEKVPEGKVTLRWEFTKSGVPDFKVGKGAPGTGKLFINGKQVGQGKIAVTCPIAYTLSGDGLCCGWDSVTPVSADYRGDYYFNGVIHHVTVDVSKDQHQAPAPPVND